MLAVLLPLLAAGEDRGGRGALTVAVSLGSRGRPQVGGSGAGAAVRASGGGLAPAASLSVFSLARPVATQPGGPPGRSRAGLWGHLVYPAASSKKARPPVLPRVSSGTGGTGRISQLTVEPQPSARKGRQPS